MEYDACSQKNQELDAIFKEMTEIVPPVSAIQTPRKESTESRFSFDHQHRPQAKASCYTILYLIKCK